MSVFFFLLGAIIGSFANVLIFRFGNNRSIMKDQRSYCDHCGKKLSWYELIPIASFLIQAGRCRSCGQRIPWWTLVVEVLMAFGFVFAACTSGLLNQDVGVEPLVAFVVVTAFVFGCVCFFFIDLIYMIIPDHVSFPLIAIGVVGMLAIRNGDWNEVAIAGILGGSFFLIQFVLSRGHWVGGGDIRLGVFLGVFLGVQKLLVALVVAYGIGMIVAIALLLLKRVTMKSALPFGTFLMVGGFLAYWQGGAIIHWYQVEAPLMMLKWFL